MTAPARFFPAWLSNHAGRRSPWCWGPPCATPSEALRLGRAEVEAGNATLAFVVRVEGREREPLPRFTYPEAARKIVVHWEELWELTDDGPPAL